MFRGLCRRAAISGLFVTVIVLPAWITSATASPPVSNNDKTLELSLPGPFNGCTILNPGATSTTTALLDLVRPSAFLTNPTGFLNGAGGPIASAELTSLSPEVVRYSIAPNEVWSNGASFSSRDLVSWWQRTRLLRSVQSDGYRAIKSLQQSKDGLTVTATFAEPYADWNLLFRDVEAQGTTTGCSLRQLISRPTLGPYRIVSATPSRMVLIMNASWPAFANRFGRIVVTTSGTIPSSPTASFVGYSSSVSRAQVQILSSHPTVLSHFGALSAIEEISFAPLRPFSSRLGVRQALSLSIDRQNLINRLWGSVTFSPSIAASAIFSQGQSSYPGSSGTGPSAQTTTTTTPATGSAASLTDCVSCAIASLVKAGFHRTSFGWATINGYRLEMRVVYGPGALDQSVVTVLRKQWASIGISVHVVEVASDMAAAQTAASNRADIAIFSRPTSTAASYAARSWSGLAFPDSYPSGWRTAATNNLYRQASVNFNPVAASSTWLLMDEAVMKDFWVRPLFTAPSLEEWSNTLGTVSPSSSVPGLVDQLLTWTSITATGP
jgi:ABC-type transport system substrate-binding protein